MGVQDFAIRTCRRPSAASSPRQVTRRWVDRLPRRRLRERQPGPGLRPARPDPEVLRRDPGTWSSTWTRPRRLLRLRPRALGQAATREGHRHLGPALGLRAVRALSSRPSPRSRRATSGSAWTTSPGRTTSWRCALGERRLHRNFMGYTTRPAWTCWPSATAPSATSATASPERAPWSSQYEADGRARRAARGPRACPVRRRPPAACGHPAPDVQPGAALGGDDAAGARPCPS